MDDDVAGKLDTGSHYTNQMSSLKSTRFDNLLPSSRSGHSGHSSGSGITDALRLMQLNDYEIKPSEIEILTNLDGTPMRLGHGAFGEVSVSRP